jgi:hypothetical protein
LTPETAFQFTGKYRKYQPACLAALQKKKKDKKKKDNTVSPNDIWVFHAAS